MKDILAQEDKYDLDHLRLKYFKLKRRCAHIEKDLAAMKVKFNNLKQSTIRKSNFPIWAE